MEGRVLIGAFDVETTGRNPEYDQIIEISVCLVDSEALASGLPAGSVRAYHQRIRPDVPISPGAQAVHGISMEDLKAEPSFSGCADQIESWLGEANVLAGYNVGFDIRFLETEFGRLGRTIDLVSRPVVDPLRIWQAMEPRRLENAHERFVGGSLEEAHSAEADTLAVLGVLAGMRSSFGLQEADWDQLAGYTSPDRATWIGPSSHFRWEADHAVFGFGKYTGRPVLEVARADARYLEWIRDKGDFPRHVKNLCKGALSGLEESEFHHTLASFYGAPNQEPVPTEEPVT